MDVQKLETLPPPPGVLNSLRVGFDVVSGRVVLIILPMILDVFLWLGPRLSIENLYGDIVVKALDLDKRAGLATQNIQEFTDTMDMVGHFNLLNFTRTLPVGISSLFARDFPESLPLETPLGIQNVIQVPSLPGFLGWLVLLTIIGWIGGGLYFRWVSQTTFDNEEMKISPMWAVIQTFIMSLIWLVGLMAILFPVISVVTALALVSPVLANGVLFVVLMLSFWLIVPFFFMPHGIFIRKQNALHSVFTSLKMARLTLPISSLFVFSVFILSTGLNYLWRVPSNDSWMMLIGIAGHAFITTALLSASFVYYREMNDWLQNVYERFLQTRQSPITQK